MKRTVSIVFLHRLPMTSYTLDFRFSFVENIETAIKQRCLPHTRSTRRSGNSRLCHNKSSAAFTLSHSSKSLCSFSGLVSIRRLSASLCFILRCRGGRNDQNLISRYDKFYITVTIYISQYSNLFSFKKVFIIFKSLIPYHFHNPCHQCQYKTNTSIKRET